MKFFQTNDEIVTSYDEALIYAYAFLKSDQLNKPEITVYKGNEIPFAFGGPNGKIPSWREFYRALKGNRTAPLICVAGCEKTDQERITIAVNPQSSKVGSNESYLLFSTSDSVNDKRINKILRNLRTLYEGLKKECVFE